jgi:hypothetical protein
VLAIGYVCKWLSELGKTEKLGGLRTVDARLNPSSEEGGLYYPRNDQFVDENDNMIHMDPF